MLEGKRNRLFVGVLGVFVVFHFASLVNVFHEVRPGMLTSATILLVLAVNTRRMMWLFLRPENFFFVAYAFILLATLLNYAFNPIVIAFTAQHPDTLITTFSYLIIPSFFFYVAGNAFYTGDKAGERVLESITWMNVGCIVAGILLYVRLPGFYVAYLFRTLENNLSLLARMSGYLGNAMMMGAISSSTIPLVCVLRRPIWVRGLLVGICLVGSFLTLERGSWAASALVLMLLAGMHLRTREVHAVLANRTRLLAGVVLIASAVTIVALNINILTAGFSMLDSSLTTRDLTVVDAFTERASQWVKVTDIVWDQPLGIGIGMLSHVTAGAGFDLAIPDGNYFRILGELGPLGLLAFLGILGGGIRRGLRHQRTFVVLALLSLALQAVGTNVFDFYYTGYLFWLLLGITYAPADRVTNAKPPLSPASR